MSDLLAHIGPPPTREEIEDDDDLPDPDTYYAERAAKEAHRAAEAAQSTEKDVREAKAVGATIGVMIVLMLAVAKADDLLTGRGL